VAVQLDAMTVALRPRSHWEAIDLGFSMARHSARAIWGAWFALLLPLAVLIHLLCWTVPWLAPLLIWWLKPMFDRIPLYVLSHATFGDTPRIRQTLRGVLPLWRRHLAWDLTLGRFDFARSFDMPVRDLEDLRGKPRRQRLAVLQKKTRSGAVWLTLVCLHLEFILDIGLFVLLYLLWPHDSHLDFSRLYLADDDAWLTALQYTFYLAAMSLMEPFYVAAGFALYLNRRTVLEGWDIEIAFRRMAQRLARLGQLLTILLGVLWLSLVAVPTPVWAADAAVPSAAQLKQRIAEVLKQPEFETEKTKRQWKYLGKASLVKPSDPAWRKWLEKFIPGLARGVEIGLWVVLAVAVIWLLMKRTYWLKWFAVQRKIPAYAAPAMLFGLDLQPQSLPDDIPATAWQLGQAGQMREALGLLYRGALAHWVTHGMARPGSNATEGDCMRLFNTTATPEAGAYFSALTQAWQRVAYAGRSPQSDALQQLCANWAVHFGAAA
jgi:hypothetical protein